MAPTSVGEARFGPGRQWTTQGQEDSAFETGQLGQLNLLFYPTPPSCVGPEFIWGRCENGDGRDAMDDRPQVSFHDDYGATILGRERYAAHDFRRSDMRSLHVSFGSQLPAALCLCLCLAPGAWAQALEPARVERVLREAHAKFQGVGEGKNADYIPALAEVPSNLFGIALVTPDGRVYEVGDSKSLFSIQSISKVFTMARVMQDSGEQVFVEGVGVDATGQVFNSIVAIEQYKGHEMNPLVNPGAIATTGKVQGKKDEEKWSKILATHEDFAGRKLEVNQPVYESEAATNQRNQAIGALMYAYGHIADDPKMVTDVYTRQCSINVSARDLAVMAGTLANGGKNPVTKKQVLDPSHVPNVLAVMATAGLYDDSGIWLYRTGLPAKSGVGGGIIAVVPGRFGIAAFSPPLDAAGNSVRAQRAIEYVAEQLGANPYHSTPR